MARSDTEMSKDRGSLAMNNSSFVPWGANTNWQEHEMAQDDVLCPVEEGPGSASEIAKAITPHTKPGKQSTRPTFRKVDVPNLVPNPNGPGWTPEERRLHKEQQRHALRESRAQRKAWGLGVDDPCGDAVEWVNGAGWYEWKAESEHREGDWFNYVKA